MWSVVFCIFTTTILVIVLNHIFKYCTEEIKSLVEYVIKVKLTVDKFIDNTSCHLVVVLFI